MKKIVTLVIFSFISHGFFAQISQTVRGSVYDVDTKHPISYVPVSLVDTGSFSQTAITDSSGKFKFKSVPLGRYTLKVNQLGYSPIERRNVLVTSGKEVVLPLPMKSTIEELDQVEINIGTQKNETHNTMATVSSRQINMEEVQRFAGGFDDPARLASSFAGVSGTTTNNGLVIRGNSPKNMLWRLEGVEIPSPNHFSDLNTFGGGGITALSSQMLDNSDFFTSAFPAEYGNALSGIMDVKMRTGNNENYEHTLQMGLMGVDASSEGPFKKGGQSSYLFNYRYATFGLITPVLPEDVSIINYQDLAFKLNFPTQKAGVFSVWGLGANDYSKEVAEDTANFEFKYEDEKESGLLNQNMAATGINHEISISKKSRLNSLLSWSATKLDYKENRYDDSWMIQPVSHINATNQKWTAASYVHTKFNANHTNRTGIIANQVRYNMALSQSPTLGDPLATVIEENDNSYLYQYYSQSKLFLSSKLSVNVGAYGQYFALNKEMIIEPRVGAKYYLDDKSTLSLGYGKHSRLDRLSVYFATQQQNNETIFPNEKLKLSKAHHFVASYDKMMGEFFHLKIEPFYQALYDIPVVDGTPFSIMHLQEDWFFNKEMTNDGTGTNYGVDITFEKFLKKGSYFLFTASLFDSKYKGGDGIERSTQYDKGYVVNFIAGKEWSVGKKKLNTLGLNGRVTYQGGNYFTPLNESASLAAEEEILNESLTFGKQRPSDLLGSININYTRNKKKHTSIWSLQILNLFGAPEYQGYNYNIVDKKFEESKLSVILPNLSYKIQF